MSKEYKRVICRVCGGRYVDLPSHKIRHEIAIKHRIKVYELQEQLAKILLK